MSKSRHEHWRIRDEYLTRLLGGLTIKRMGFWLEGSPKEEEGQFCIELQDGTFIFTNNHYDEHWIEVWRPSGTKFAVHPNAIHGLVW